VGLEQGDGVRILRADDSTPFYPQKLALTLQARGGRSVIIVRSRTKATELLFEYFSNFKNISSKFLP
jgi:hypothetical protein